MDQRFIFKKDFALMTDIQRLVTECIEFIVVFVVNESNYFTYRAKLLLLVNFTYFSSGN